MVSKNTYYAYIVINVDYLTIKYPIISQIIPFIKKNKKPIKPILFNQYINLFSNFVFVYLIASILTFLFLIRSVFDLSIIVFAL